MIRHSIFFISLLLCIHFSNAQNALISFSKKSNDFTLSSSGKSAPLYVSTTDFVGVTRALKDLQNDIKQVTDAEPTLVSNKTPNEHEVVIVGTIGKSDLIDQLIQNKKIDVSSIKDKWESFLIKVVDKPFPNVDRALVIAGNDKRGTIFGIYEISKQIGVSPWYWWADVPVKKNKNLFVSSNINFSDAPAVKYRGIFLNDEEPSLGRWAVEKYGGFNHQFYEKLFELILRLKGNFLWPAMWWGAFNADDPLSPQLADDYGIVMSTSHHEPMMRAHAEWKKTGKGDWNYETNADVLKKFWREGIERMSNRESIVTLAMRGDGDMAMSEGTKTALLEKIVKDQREIIVDVTKKDITQTPQVWAIYKEVQDYYDKGMRVPDDVTLLFCDDNWGNVRKVPNLKDKQRSGGYGMYYHFDYVGGPRNYKWINTSTINKTWEQMHLSYEYGIDRIWIVNVGDLKPLEYPISFFLDYAWNPKQWNQNNLQQYNEQWCEQQFGQPYSKEIANIISKYSKFNARRKPELITPETYSQVNYHEAENIVNEYRAIEKSADEIYSKLTAEQKDAFYQLVLYPVKASANLNDIYATVGKNKLYASQGRILTNELADKAKQLYVTDSLLSYYYNNTLANGKWHNMMNQIHMGYTYWQDPPKQVMPEIKKIENATQAKVAIAIEGSEKSWSINSNDIILPEFNSYQKSEHYFEIFNQGETAFDFTISSDAKWLKFSKTKGTIKDEERIVVSVDWSSTPKGLTQSTITVNANNKSINIIAKINNRKVNDNGFVEIDHYISIEAEHFDKAVNNNEIHWQILPDYGRTLSGVEPFPVTAKAQTLSNNSPHLEYNLLLTDTASIDVQFQLGTTLNFNGKGLQLAVSLDDETPRIINIHENETEKIWNKTVEDNVRIVSSKWKIKSAGKHILKYWMIDPGIVLQKVIVDAGGLKPSYLGPQESPKANGKL